MTCLALEFSTDRRSVAVAQDERLLAEVVHEGTLKTPLFSLIRAALERAGVEVSQVGRLSVGLGPGSYTGIRMAISVAQGWQLGREIETVGLSSLDNLAVAALQSGMPEPVLLAVDAQRGEFAAAMAENGKVVEPVRLLPLEEIRLRLNRGVSVAGPEIARVLPAARALHPTAAILAVVSRSHAPVPAETLAPIYLREAGFVKAPPARVLSIPDGA